MDEKTKRMCNRASSLIEKNQFYKAQNLLKKVNRNKDIPEVSRLFSILYWKQGENLQAEEFALKTIAVCPEKNPLIYYLLGEINYERKMYVHASKYLEKAINLGLNEAANKKAEKMYKKAKVIADIINNPVPFSPQVVKGISTKADEYLPILSPDQEIVFYTRRGEKNEIGSLTNTMTEEFVFSKEETTDFNTGNPMPFPFNRNSNEGGASITIDNKTLYFTTCSNLSSGYNNCDLFYTFKQKDGGWSEIISFKKKINSVKSWESQPSISADGNTLIFASDRKGGFGGADLYLIQKNEKGEWSDPKNLGENINTKYNEKSPFLHTDNETMFFASNQFPSVGGYDIFFCRKDSLGNWQKPKNIGYPINTISDELGLFVSTDGKKAYFASNQLDGVGGWDLYSFDLYEGAKPKKVLFLKGELRDENGEVLRHATIELKNIQSKEKHIVQVQNGEYAAAYTIEDGDDVLLTINKKGYAFNSTYISSDDADFSSPKKIDFEVEKLGDGKAFRLDNIYFASNSFELNPISKEILMAFADYLILNKNLKVAIHGHTDNIGSASANLLLSKNRAKAVFTFLLDNGIVAGKLDYKGFGKQEPIASNDTQKGRAQNRRTEFVILGQ
ncbi:MAG: OmpA family protein [Flavobacteriales bacterium]|nr:OmpA family protein [Flavobacteriales bacterium]